MPAREICFFQVLNPERSVANIVAHVDKTYTATEFLARVDGFLNVCCSHLVAAAAGAHPSHAELFTFSVDRLFMALYFETHGLAVPCDAAVQFDATEFAAVMAKFSMWLVERIGKHPELVPDFTATLFAGAAEEFIQRYFEQKGNAIEV